MTIPHEYINAFLYLLLITFAIAFETYTFGRWWQANEFARRTMGIATVMLLALPFVALETIDAFTWLVISSAFAIAGAIRGIRFVNDENSERDAEMQQAQSELEQANDETV